VSFTAAIPEAHLQRLSVDDQTAVELCTQKVEHVAHLCGFFD
jgi:hypothetical protein